ncbi:MAG: hypothetical protein IKD08_04835 [Alphaproteobacteria bacterium]|nr:hypothetical protein [Alphaproteobacteria bacterium]
MTNNPMIHNEIPGVSNVKGNSYDITVNGEKYRITMKKGPKHTRKYIDRSFPSEIDFAEVQPFCLEAKSANNRSFSIYFEIEDNHLTGFSLTSYRLNGEDKPVPPIEPKEYRNYAPSYKIQYGIPVNAFYDEAFAKPFNLGTPPTFKEVMLSGEYKHGKSLVDRFLTEDISLEELAEAYLTADDVFAKDKQKCAEQLPKYQAGLSPFKAEKAKVYTTISALGEELQNIDAKISVYNQEYPEEVVAYAANMEAQERAKATGKKELNPQEIYLRNAFQKIHQ